MEIMVEFHSLWQLLPAITHRQGARALRDLMARRSDQDGQSREPQALRRRFAGARLRLGDAGDPLGVSRPFGDRRGRRGHARSLLVRRISRKRARSRRWRRPGTCRSRRTTAPDPVVLCASTHLSLNAPNALIQESVRAYLPHLVPRARHGAAGGARRLHHRPPRPRARRRARARSRREIHSDGQTTSKEL